MKSELDKSTEAISQLTNQVSILIREIRQLKDVFQEYISLGVNLEQANSEKKEELGEIISKVSGKKKSSMWASNDE